MMKIICCRATLVAVSACFASASTFAAAPAFAVEGHVAATCGQTVEDWADTGVLGLYTGTGEAAGGGEGLPTEVGVAVSGDKATQFAPGRVPLLSSLVPATFTPGVGYTWKNSAGDPYSFTEPQCTDLNAPTRVTQAYFETKSVASPDSSTTAIVNRQP
ncbi:MULTISPECIES: hypothetical protein [Streptomyces]|uniref:hypothetical protein n=1 Tax=Streptomyces TaxID=1883 RepID=UPI0018DEFCC3|nr:MULTISPECIES: hypothetical protein [Streptomyces]MCZ4103392.1 hypothetical protein [Streptomyces sp. H39-C1]